MTKRAAKRKTDVICIKCDELAEHDHTMLCAYCARDWKVIQVKTSPSVRVSS